MNELEPRVFVVKDEESVRKSLADLLATEDYSVEIFAGAAEFLARVPQPGSGCVVHAGRLIFLPKMVRRRRVAIPCGASPSTLCSGGGKSGAPCKAHATRVRGLPVDD
jgi:hypothetical protein